MDAARILAADRRARTLLLASLVAGISFWIFKAGVPSGPLLMVWKGAGVALLACYALVAAQHGTAGQGPRQIAGVMALGALGDVLIEIRLEAGAIAFLLGHLVAIHLYLSHRRSPLPAIYIALAVAALALIPSLSFLLPIDRNAAPGVALYALGLAGMAATAWISRFPHRSVGLGAALFVISDLLIFTRLGPLANSPLPDLLIWPLYYFGQMLICLGVSTWFKSERPDHAPDKACIA